MKVLKITTEARAYSEEEAKEYIEAFRVNALPNTIKSGRIMNNGRSHSIASS